MRPRLKRRSIYHENYTGSGIEMKAQKGQEYICFFRQLNKKVSLLRLEETKNEKNVMALRKKHLKESNEQK